MHTNSFWSEKRFNINSECLVNPITAAFDPLYLIPAIKSIEYWLSYGFGIRAMIPIFSSLYVSFFETRLQLFFWSKYAGRKSFILLHTRLVTGPPTIIILL